VAIPGRFWGVEKGVFHKVIRVFHKTNRVSPFSKMVFRQSPLDFSVLGMVFRQSASCFPVLEMVFRAFQKVLSPFLAIPKRFSNHKKKAVRMDAAEVMGIKNPAQGRGNPSCRRSGTGPS